ncbi:MAG: hypothetical protein WBG73_02265, partial [Coleofasciculaceae cyanobacterium]
MMEKRSPSVRKTIKRSLIKQNPHDIREISTMISSSPPELQHYQARFVTKEAIALLLNLKK